MLRLVIAAAVLSSILCSGIGHAEKLVIADGGETFFPENSLPDVLSIISGGSNYIQIELVMTADDQVVALSDITLNTITDVEHVFPERARDDGNFYAVDFTYNELQTLRLRSQPTGLTDAPSDKYPLPHFHIPSFADILGLLRIRETPEKQPVTLVAEIKKSWFHQHEGKDTSLKTLEVLDTFGFTSAEDGIIIASYDPEELQRIRETLFTATGIQTKLLQLIGHNDGSETLRFERGRWLPYNYDWMSTKFGLKAVSAYADAVGLLPELFVDETGAAKQPHYLEDARLLGLQVFVYPIDHLLFELVGYGETAEELVDHFLFSFDFDGLLTSRTNLFRTVIASRTKEHSPAEDQPQSIEQLIENMKNYSKRADTPLQKPIPYNPSLITN
jgi:glycerophosphoryl diester phosphodiesterase